MAGNCRRNGNRFSEIVAKQLRSPMDGKEIEKLKLRLRDRRAKIQCNDYLEATVGKAIRDWEMFLSVSTGL